MHSVHGTHCCKKHGCKYGDDNCPVVLGKESQAYKQECCDVAAEYLLDAYETVMEDLNGVCGGDEVNEFLRLRCKEVRREAKNRG